MAWLAKLIGTVGSYILEKVLQTMLAKISHFVAKKRASQAQSNTDYENAKQFGEAKTDYERHKSGEQVLNGD